MATPKIWKIGIGRNSESSYSELKEQYCVSQGWREFGDLSFLYHNNENISSMIKAFNPKENRAYNAFESLMSKINPGDIVLAFEGNDLKGITQMPTDSNAPVEPDGFKNCGFVYFYNEAVEEYRQSLFPVKWVDWQDFRSEFSDDTSLDEQGGQGVAGVVACGSGDTLAPIKELILKNWEKFKAKHKNIVDFAHDDSDDQKILAKLNVLRENLSERRITSYKRYQAMVKQRTFDASTLEQECLELLKANYNLILSGAPGTGKTYIAKQLAVHLIKENKLIKAQDILSSCIKNFKKQDSLYEDHERLCRNFLEEFSLEKLSSLTLEKYCIGKGDNKSFCWWMEFGLKSLGSFSPGMSDGYLIYWSKDQQRYILSGYAEQLQKAHADWNIEEIFNDIKEKLVSLIKADFQDIPKFTNYFLSSFILKILSTYRNQEFFPINSNKHLTNLIEMLGINCSTDADVFTKNQEIYNFYKKCTDSVENNEACEMSPECFNDILYANFDIEDKTIKEDSKIFEYLKNSCFVQFHPSYDYTDFVEGLRPYFDSGDAQNNNGNQSSALGFRREDGIFKSLCKKAIRNPNNKYVLIIDEINRGDISKIFGELFYSIDPDYRGESNKVKTQYQNLVSADDEFADGFYVPKNIYIIGTMNDIDRSVDSMDFALRRRFVFREISAQDSKAMLDILSDDVKEICIRKMDVLNKRIYDVKNHEGIEGLNSAYHIGAAYFLKIQNYLKNNGKGNPDHFADAFEKLWNNHLKGLLFEYLRGMPDAQNKLEQLKKAYETR